MLKILILIAITYVHLACCRHLSETPSEARTIEKTVIRESIDNTTDIQQITATQSMTVSSTSTTNSATTVATTITSEAQSHELHTDKHQERNESEHLNQTDNTTETGDDISAKDNETNIRDFGKLDGADESENDHKSKDNKLESDQVAHDGDGIDNSVSETGTRVNHPSVIEQKEKHEPILASSNTASMTKTQTTAIERKTIEESSATGSAQHVSAAQSDQAQNEEAHVDETIAHAHVEAVSNDHVVEEIPETREEGATTPANDANEGQNVEPTMVTQTLPPLIKIESTTRDPNDVDPLDIFVDDIRYQRFPTPMEFDTFKEKILGKPFKKLYILEESDKKLFRNVRQLEAEYTMEEDTLYVSFLFRFIFSRQCQEIKKFRLGKHVGNTNKAYFEKELQDGVTERIIFFTEMPEDYVYFVSCTDLKTSPYACRDKYYVTLDSAHDPPNQFPWLLAAEDLRMKMNLSFKDPRFVFNFVMMPCARSSS